MAVRFDLSLVCSTGGSPGGSEVKNLPANAGDEGLIPGLGRSPRGGHGNPLQYSCLENHMDRGAWQTIVHGAWQTIVHGVAKSQAQLKQLSTDVHTLTVLLSQVTVKHTLHIPMLSFFAFLRWGLVSHPQRLCQTV